MPKRGRIEDKLAALHALRADPSGVDATRELRAAIRSKTGVIAAAAAEIIGDAGIDDLASELPAAFQRFLDDPIKRDPRCRAKSAIAKVLIERSQWDDDVFAAGIRHVQREPVWGGSEDTAAGLRGMCALAYAQLGHADAVVAIAELLADPERTAREVAARALGDSGRPEAIPLLRFKARIGDAEPVVLSAAFGSLLVLDPRDSFAFVASFLTGDADAVAEAAALALGESRSEAALPYLRAWCDDAVTDDHRRIGYLALTLLRHDDATRYLLDVVRSGPQSAAEAAVRALATFAHDPELAERVRAAAREHGADAVPRAVTEWFS